MVSIMLGDEMPKRGKLAALAALTAAEDAAAIAQAKATKWRIGPSIF
jgi:hypothetical protein